MSAKEHPYVINFKKLSSKDLLVVGGKGSNLGEMTQVGVPVPPGFVVTTRAYYEMLEESGLREPITEILDNLDVNDTRALNNASKKIEDMIKAADVPTEVRKAIVSAYASMSGFQDALVAVRSSATAEDIPGASFAGQQATYLNVKGPRNLVDAVRDCWASLFEPRAIFYRVTKGFEHMKVGIAVPVQKMVQSEVSGVMFTVDPVSNDESKVAIEAVYGLGETIVSGAVTPDSYLVNKKSMKIEDKRISNQDWMLVRRPRPKEGETNIKVNVSETWQKRQKLSDKHIVELAKIGRLIEKHYKYPQDIEWAFAGNKLWIVQSRPVTTLEGIEEDKGLKADLAIEVKALEKEVAKEVKEKEEKVEVVKIKEEDIKIPLDVLIEGVPASPGIISGKIRVIKSSDFMEKLIPGEILVTGMTTPSWVPIMKKASAIITDQGGSTAHAAIVSRELGIPCVVGTQVATKVLRTGEWVTLDGKAGLVYEGKMDSLTVEAKEDRAEEEEKAKETAVYKDVDVKEIIPEYKKIKTATKVYVNLGEPDLAEKVSKMHVDGVGLLRAEFMLAEIGMHPKKALTTEKRREKFVQKLANDIAVFCENFGPERPIIYRATDFKTNEYRALEGGAEFEFEESNPMIGYRGVSRYLDNPDVFKMEMEALRIVRNKMNHRNLWLMLPFVRTVDELIAAKKLVTAAKLRRSSTFKLFMMVEVPSNVIMIDEFIAAGIDGVSMGTNDLTQLTLGVDRDNPKVQKIFDERDPAVLWSMERVVRACHKNKIACSICGQAPSVYPEITEKLVEWGVTSVSVNADVIDKTREIVAAVERKLIERRKK